MPANSNFIPSYRHHKPTNQAFVELNRHRFYLGRYGSPESRQEYNRLVGEWESRGRTPPLPTTDVRVVEILAAFMSHAREYYRRADGTQTTEVENFQLATKFVEELYGDRPAAKFDSLALLAVRDRMIAAKWVRRSINKHCQRIVRLFRWAASRKLIDASVATDLATVEGLRRGRSAAKESDPVRPVAEADIEAIRGHVSKQIWAMIQLQLRTAARPGEIIGIRAIDIDMTGAVWTYKPPCHKNDWRGHDRVIHIGPTGQEVIKPFLAGRPVDKPLFSPAESQKDRRAERSKKRKTPLHQGNRPGAIHTRNPKRPARERFCVAAYRRAVTRGCKAAGIDAWSPHGLRHTAATQLRKQFGIEAAAILLGHRDASTTLIYAEADQRKAADIAAKVG